jgi:hypothetical protein
VCCTKSCREESTEHGDDEVSEKTSPQKLLEEEYLETEKKVLFDFIALILQLNL